MTTTDVSIDVFVFVVACQTVALLGLAGLCLWLARRVSRLEDFDELEMCARERLGRLVKRLRARVIDPWEVDDDESDDDDE